MTISDFIVISCAMIVGCLIGDASYNKMTKEIKIILKEKEENKK